MRPLSVPPEATSLFICRVALIDGRKKNRVEVCPVGATPRLARGEVLAGWRWSVYAQDDAGRRWWLRDCPSPLAAQRVAMHAAGSRPVRGLLGAGRANA